MKAPTRELCATCEKTVYPTERTVIEGMTIHKTCFVCKHCSRKLTISNFAAVRLRWTRVYVWVGAERTDVTQRR